MSRLKNYLSLVKFSHTLFALPFAMIGFFLGIFGQKTVHEVKCARHAGFIVSFFPGLGLYGYRPKCGDGL